MSVGILCSSSTRNYALYPVSQSTALAENQGITELHIVIAGATAHAEQRLLFDTNYWMEIGYVYKNISKIYLHFVGPEAATAATKRNIQHTGTKI